MTSPRISYKFNYPDYPEIIKRNRRRIDIFIAAQMQFNRSMVFDAEGAYNGHPKWAPLKWRQGRILQKSGALRNSIVPQGMDGKAGKDGIVRFAGDMVIIGTQLYYARMMNNGTVGLPGGVLRPRKALALKIPGPGGGSTVTAKKTKFIFRKSVKIEPRKFDQVNDQDAEEISIALCNLLAKLLSEG